VKVDVTIQTTHRATIDIGEINPQAFKAIMFELSSRGIDSFSEWDIADFESETLAVEVEGLKSR
jgi:hypothetical protein